MTVVQVGTLFIDVPFASARLCKFCEKVDTTHLDNGAHSLELQPSSVRFLSITADSKYMMEELHNSGLYEYKTAFLKYCSVIAQCSVTADVGCRQHSNMFMSPDITT